MYGWGYHEIPDPDKPVCKKHHKHHKNCYPQRGDKYLFEEDVIIMPEADCSKCDITKNPQIMNYVLKSSVPACPDLRDYIKKSDIPACPNLDDYIKKSDLPACDCPKCDTRPYNHSCPSCPRCPKQKLIPQIYDKVVIERPDMNGYVSKEQCRLNVANAVDKAVENARKRDCGGWFVPNDRQNNSDLYAPTGEFVGGGKNSCSNKGDDNKNYNDGGLFGSGISV